MRKLIASLLLLPSLALAATEVTLLYSGTIDHGETVIIRGTDFGTKSTAAPWIWDNFEGGSAVFELADEDHHDHMVCMETGAVVEFMDDVIESRQHAIAEEYGYEIVDHSLVLYVKPKK